MSRLLSTLQLAAALALGTVGVLWWVERGARGWAEVRARAAEAEADSLRGVGRQFREVYRTDTLRLTRWRTTWDTVRVLARQTDTVTIERVIEVADSTIGACEAARRTCEERVAVAEGEAAAERRAAANWKRLARGPWLQPSVLATVRPDREDPAPRLDAELAIGRGAWQLVGRGEWTPGDSLTWRAGVRWRP